MSGRFILALAGIALLVPFFFLPHVATVLLVAAALALLAAARAFAGAPTEPLTPLYLRRPDAVEPGQRKAVS